MIIKRDRFARIVLSCALAAVVAAPLALRAAEAPHDAISYADTWAKGLDYVRHGEFDRAGSLLEDLAAKSGDPERAEKWVEDWLAQEKTRREMTEADYEDYVGRAKKWFDKENLDRALKWSYLAMLYSDDQDAFRQLAWVHQIKDAALAEASKRYAAHEWRDAHELYYALNLIFEHDKDIDKRRKDCLEHARLDEIYKSERDWQESLEGITPAMVEEALYRIDQKYVEEADFKKMTIAGFEELLLIAESPTLRELFDGLRNERGEEFVSRIESRLRNIKEQPLLTYREALHHFRRALKINNQTAQIPTELLAREYMNASLEELDEFSSMIWPYDFREFEKHTRGDFVGVGIQIRNKYNQELKDTEILVVSPLEDTPAYRAGIQADDVITKVNGKSLLGVGVTKAVGMITGPLDTTVTLTIRRESESGELVERDVPLKRAIIEIQSVKGFERRSDDEQRWDTIIDPELGIAYMRVLSFQDNTVAQLRAALEEARHQGMRGLILDLRYNPGGLLKSAVEMAELFLPRGERIVSTKGLRSREWYQDTDHDGEFEDLPLIVLVNESSASASEIVSGAIRDHKRGLVVGERTFGKFSVQNLIQLVHSEAHLKLTTARYYLPSGRSLHRDEDSTEWGVEPEVTVALVPKEQSKIIFMRRDADVIGAVKTNSEDELDEPFGPAESETGASTAGDSQTTAKESDDAAATVKKSDDAEEEEDPDPNNRPRRDPQLDTAVLVMRLHLLSEDAQRVANVAPVEHEEPITAE